MKSSMTLRYVGNGEMRRFYIERKDGKFWTGEEWGYRPCLWADLRSANNEYNRLQLEPFIGQPAQEFECRLVFRVHGDQPFTLEQLREYLFRSLRITVDVEAHGDGPAAGVFLLPLALLESLRRADQESP